MSQSGWRAAFVPSEMLQLLMRWVVVELIVYELRCYPSLPLESPEGLKVNCLPWQSHS